MYSVTLDCSVKALLQLDAFSIALAWPSLSVQQFYTRRNCFCLNVRIHMRSSVYPRFMYILLNKPMFLLGANRQHFAFLCQRTALRCS